MQGHEAMCRHRHRHCMDRMGLGWILPSIPREMRFSGGRTVRGGAFPSGCIHLPEGLRPVFPVVISSMPEHKTLEMEVQVRHHQGAHKSFPITFLLPVPTISHCLNPWVLSSCAARERHGGKFGTFSGWHPSEQAHNTEDGPGRDSCTATPLCVGPKKFKLS